MNMGESNELYFLSIVCLRKYNVKVNVGLIFIIIGYIVVI